MEDTIIPGQLANISSVDMAWDRNFRLSPNTPGVFWENKLSNDTTNGLTNILSIAAGANFTVALHNDGTVTATGDNSFGETNVPAGLANVIAIAAGNEHVLALKSDGTVTGWGAGLTNGPFPHSGQVLVPVGLTNVMAIAAGESYSLALKADGTVTGWGDGAFGVTNVPAVNNITAIAAGSFHVLALCSNGTVIAWGDNAFGQTNVPAGLTNVIAVAAGWNQSLALRNDGTAVIWGNNTFGQTNAPLCLSNIVAIAARDNRSLVIETQLKVLSSAKSGNNAVLQFWSFAGRHYSLQFQPALGSGSWQATDISEIPGSGQGMVFTETNAISTAPQGFYRIREDTP
jgi:alpha-tubulin suppressor-like RCC1 family protein